MLSASRKAPTEANGKEAGVEPGADKGKVVDAEIPIKDPTSEVLAALAAASAANNSDSVVRAQHCTGMTNWQNTIQCLGSDDLMSLGIKFSAFVRVEHLFARKFEVQVIVFEY